MNMFWLILILVFCETLSVSLFLLVSVLRNHWKQNVTTKKPYVRQVGVISKPSWISVLCKIGRDHVVYAPSQWKTTLHSLQCNVVSHWLRAYTKWSLDRFKYVSAQVFKYLKFCCCFMIWSIWKCMSLVCHRLRLELLRRKRWKSSNWWNSNGGMRKTGYGGRRNRRRRSVGGGRVTHGGIWWGEGWEEDRRGQWEGSLMVGSDGGKGGRRTGGDSGRGHSWWDLMGGRVGGGQEGTVGGVTHGGIWWGEGWEEDRRGQWDRVGVWVGVGEEDVSGQWKGSLMLGSVGILGGGGAGECDWGWMGVTRWDLVGVWAQAGSWEVQN